MKENLRKIVEGSDSFSGRLFDTLIGCLIFLSIISFSLETLPHLPDSCLDLLYLLELFIITVFTVEYMLRFYLARRKFQFVMSLQSWIDLIAILPFFFFSDIDLRSIRILWLFRSFRIFRIFRLMSTTIRIKKSILSIKDELIVFSVASSMLLYIAAVGIYYFENPVQPESFSSIFHCLWWAIVTMTTVGYGDMYPITTGGKIFSSCILILGISIIAIPTGLLAASFTKKNDDFIKHDDHTLS